LTRVGGARVARRRARAYDRVSMAAPLIETPEQANRLARAICSDVALYNEEKVVRGLEQDNLFDVLSEEIEEGRQLYRSRVSPALYDRTNFYDRAIVDVIIRPKGHVKTKIW
jgi:spore germination protein GerM